MNRRFSWTNGIFGSHGIRPVLTKKIQSGELTDLFFDAIWHLGALFSCSWFTDSQLARDVRHTKLSPVQQLDPTSPFQNLHEKGEPMSRLNCAAGGWDMAVGSKRQIHSVLFDLRVGRWGGRPAQNPSAKLDQRSSNLQGCIHIPSRNSPLSSVLHSKNTFDYGHWSLVYVEHLSFWSWESNFG